MWGPGDACYPQWNVWTSTDRVDNCQWRCFATIIIEHMDNRGATHLSTITAAVSDVPNQGSIALEEAVPVLSRTQGSSREECRSSLYLHRPNVL